MKIKMSKKQAEKYAKEIVTLAEKHKLYMRPKKVEK